MGNSNAVEILYAVDEAFFAAFEISFLSSFLFNLFEIVLMMPPLKNLFKYTNYVDSMQFLSV